MHKVATPRCSFGIEGLDDITAGGLPCNRLYLTQGNPGAGKTTLGLLFLLEGLKRGEKVFYISLSETKEELAQVADSHGWSLDGIDILELSTIERHLQTLAPDTLFHPSEIELNRTAEFLMQRISESKPARVVLDSLAELKLMSETPLRYRRQMLALKQFFSGSDVTVMMLDDQLEQRDLQVLSIAHGVLTLELNILDFGVERRRLKFSKLRGVRFRGGYHDYIVRPGGIDVFPRLVASEHGSNRRTRNPLKSGIDELDALLGGGLDLGTSTLFLGPAGTGKSTLALQVAVSAASNGKKASIFTFDENAATLIERGDSLGMKVSERLGQGGVTVAQIDPASLTPGEFVDRIKRQVLSEDVGVVVIDSLNGYLNTAPSERFLTIQLHELLTFLSHRGVVTMLTIAQQGMVGSMHGPVDVTYLADTVVLLRFFEAAGSVHKAISVTKKRTGKPEETIREFRIDSQGIRVGEPLKAFHGVLTGVPTFVGRPDEMLPNRLIRNHAIL
jgi:circadian clock protein KaiC